MPNARFLRLRAAQPSPRLASPASAASALPAPRTWHGRTRPADDFSVAPAVERRGRPSRPSMRRATPEVTLPCARLRFRLSLKLVRTNAKYYLVLSLRDAVGPARRLPHPALGAAERGGPLREWVLLCGPDDALHDDLFAMASTALDERLGSHARW